MTEEKFHDIKSMDSWQIKKKTPKNDFLIRNVVQVPPQHYSHIKINSNEKLLKQCKWQ